MSRASGAVALAAAGAFATLAALVGRGHLTSIDQWAVGHAMPGAQWRKPTITDALVPLWGEHWHGGVTIATNVLTAPGALVIATVVVAIACRRVGGRAGAALAAAYVAGNVVEELVKSTLMRPPLYARGLHLAAFDSSYPSGHTIRVVLLAAAVALAWPRLRVPATLWAAVTVVFLELGGWHVPSDIAGALLLDAALLATTWTSCFARESSSSPWPASRPSSRAR
ncbi:MAG TPA: phosphatase PAP2 family protein [Gaiellaceae bacterium]|nr:phosphatase PAP2 family protein [Gaiellaceae bacterium]